MIEKYLTLEQNICAARVFLNTFGLILEDVSDIDEFSKIKIFDKAQNKVGELSFNDGKVIMSASYNNSLLDASFDIAKMKGFVDTEGEDALFGQWFSKISFQVQKSSDIKLYGEFLIESSADSEFGVSCDCHPLIYCDIAGQGKITLKILREGRTFGLEVASGSYNETIDIMPWDDINGFIKHVITNGKYDEKTYKHEYKRYAGVFSGAERGEDKDKLHVFLVEEEHDTRLAFHNELVQKVGDDHSEEVLIQKGHLMKQLDPAMYEKIEKLRKILFIGDVSLLDNLISICYDSYTDEGLISLLGIKRQPMNHQSGADSLVKAYFEIGISNCFFPLETQKKLPKK